MKEGAYLSLSMWPVDQKQCKKANNCATEISEITETIMQENDSKLKRLPSHLVSGCVFLVSMAACNCVAWHCVGCLVILIHYFLVSYTLVGFCQNVILGIMECCVQS